MVGKKYTPDGSANASLENATTGTGKAVAVNDCRQVTWEVIYITPPTVGTLIIEYAPTFAYAGTWHQLDSINCANLSAGTEGFGTYPGQIGFMRGRFTVNSDQAITVYVNGLLG